MSKHMRVDIYGALGFEPMPCLSLGLSEQLEDNLVELLKAESRVPTAMICVRGACRTFNQIRKPVPTLIIGFVLDVGKSSPAFRMRIVYRKPEFGGGLAYFFKDSIIGEIQKASDYKGKNRVSPFFVEISERLRDLIVGRAVEALVLMLMLQTSYKTEGGDHD